MAGGPLGFDSAARIHEEVAGAETYWGQASFYMRYMSPHPGIQTFIEPTMANALTEMQAAWNAGITRVGFVVQPGQGRIGTQGTYAKGATDANVATDGMMDILGYMTNVGLSARVAIYLDVEAGTSLNTNYWKGFSETVNTWNIVVPGIGALFYWESGLYCNPNDAGINCSLVDNYTQSSDYRCVSVWSTGFDPSVTCSSFANVWDANECGSNYPPAEIWQMTFPCSCGNCGSPCVEANCHPNVDTDQAWNSTVLDRMLLISGLPLAQ